MAMQKGTKIGLAIGIPLCLIVLACILIPRYISFTWTDQAGEQRVLFGASFYDPPEPNAPTTYMQSLGQVHRDKDAGYTVHAIAADRRTFYDMFPVIARQYALSVDQLWFWGDGSSSQGATADHIYRDPGKYEVTLRTTVGFRGGNTKVITAQAIIELDNWSGPYVFNKTTTLPTEPIDVSDQNPLTFAAEVWNTGSSEVVIIPHAIIDSNPSLDSTWVAFDPPVQLLLPDSVHANFSITIDPNGVEPGAYTISLDWEQFALVPGWYMTYVEPS